MYYLLRVVCRKARACVRHVLELCTLTTARYSRKISTYVVYKWLRYMHLYSEKKTIYIKFNMLNLRAVIKKKNGVFLGIISHSRVGVLY